VPTGAVTKTNGFIYTSYLNGDSKNFFQPLITLSQNGDSVGRLPSQKSIVPSQNRPVFVSRLRSDVFRLGVDFLPARFFVVFRFFGATFFAVLFAVFFALGILFSLCFI
jgi:hypothetical protein